MRKGSIFNIIYALRNIYIGDDEQSRLLENIDETIESFKSAGVQETDLIRLRVRLTRLQLGVRDENKHWDAITKILERYMWKNMETFNELYSKCHDWLNAYSNREKQMSVLADATCELLWYFENEVQ